MAQQQASFWSIDVPNGWAFEHAPPIAYLYCISDQCGTLQIVSVSKRAGPVMADELEHDAQRGARLQHAITKSVSYGPFSGWTAEYTDEGEDGSSRWRVWWLASGSIRLDIRYDCDGVHQATPPACHAIEAILCSLRPLS